MGRKIRILFLCGLKGKFGAIALIQEEKEEGSKMEQSPSKRCYKIGGISVEFPYKPYGSQLAYMGKVVATLERAQKQRQGHCHALLESPTGTGKSLALLCATLAWQQHHKSRLSAAPAAPHPPAQQPTHTQNAVAMGGGFIPEDTQSGIAAAESQQPASGIGDGAERKPKVPTIFYASRTHSQITQVIREYRKTVYRVPMAVLASRKHYCTNKRVCSKKNVDEECKLLLKDSEQSCPQFKNAYKVKYHSSLRKGGCNEVHDIEDLVKVGHTVKGCSYFAARDMALEAQLVFCPYNYILNPIIRRAMEVDVKGDIVILDEAHNIEDMSREAGSLDVDENVLDVLQKELGQLSCVDGVADIYQPLLDMVQGLMHWIHQKSNSLEKREFERYCSCWTGDKALRELQAAGIAQDYFPLLQQCALKAIKAASEAEKNEIHLSGLSASTLEGLFSSLTYFFSENGQGASDYQLSLQKYVKRDERMAVQGWTHSFSLWCLNPSVVFKEIAESSLAVILTSGTLSPMNSFASELGVPFEICMEAPHVINMDSQVWVAAVAAGPGNVSLNASYKTADGYAFQDALGAALEEICKVVPNGTLIFFPSYKLMDKLCNRWKTTGQWNRLNSQKTVFVEPRGNQDDFEPVLSGYYRAIFGVKKFVYRGKDSLKQAHNSGSSTEGLHVRSKGGAAFMAVCRGKVSEGIDFSDENARAVVVVGIPFPNKKDIQVELKKQYNDANKSSKNLLSGSQWYCQQAFRALNQAVGRCIRHRHDFGAIILLDERFKRASNLEYMSKWLRNSIRQFDNFDQSLEGLHGFFRKVEDQKPEVIASCQNLMTKKLSTLDCGSLTYEENASLPKAKSTTKAVSKKATETILDFFSPELVGQDSEMTHELGSVCDSMGKSVSPHDSNMITNEDMEAKPAMQGNEDDHSNAEGHANSILRDQKQSECFKLSLQETNGYQSSLHTEDIAKEIKLSSACSISLTEAETMEPCAGQRNCQIQTPIQAIGPTDSGKPFYDSPDLANSCAADAFVSNHCSSSSVCISGNNSSRKRRNPITFQLDDNVKRIDFDQQTEANDLYQQYQASCGMSTANKVASCQIGNACLQGNAIFLEDNKGESAFTSSSIAQTTEVEGLGSNVSTGGVLGQTQGMEFSAVQTPKPQPDSSICSSSQYNLKITAVASKDIFEKVCSLSCIFCGNYFGLPEKQFLVKCTLTSLSKSYISILANKNLECYPKVDNIEERSSTTPVIISDVAFLNELFTKRPDSSKRCLTSSTEDSQLKSIWVEEDGCVFKALLCPHCEASRVCVGVHVVATNASNASLLDKVIFLRDHVKVVDGDPPVPREVHHQSQVNFCNGVNNLSIEDYCFNSKRVKSVTTKTKLKLPKKE